MDMLFYQPNNSNGTKWVIETDIDDSNSFSK